MKYFIGINTAAELKEAYRSFCLRLHPDHGGDAEEFKAMMAEYEHVCKSMNSWTDAAEERARREQEKREEQERIRKAQEETRKKVLEWADRLERLTMTTDESKLRYYRFKDKQEASAYVAVTKRNVKAVINHYYPDLKVKVSIQGAIWKEVFTISWEDGPGEDALEQTCKELSMFIPSYYVSAGPGEDYGHHEERKATAPWREAYGSALGDTDDIKFERTLSDEGKAQAEALAASIFEHWTDGGSGEMFEASLSEWLKLATAFGHEKDQFGTPDTRGMEWSSYARCERYEESRGSVAYFYISSVRNLLYANASVNVDEKAKQKRKEAAFKPKYGKALATLYKLTGVGKENVVFWWKEEKGFRRWESHTLTTEEAIERMLAGESVYFGEEHKHDDGSVSHWGTYNGGYKTQQKRAEKWSKEGYTLTSIGYGNTTSYVSICGVTPEVAAAVRKDLKHVERQRQAWEAERSATPSDDENDEKSDKEVNQFNNNPQNETTMANKKSTNNESANTSAIYSVITYQTKKGGTACYIAGFKTEAEAKALADNACKTVSVTWRHNDKGEKVWALFLGARYSDIAIRLCDALNKGDKAAVSKAIAETHDVYAAAVAAGRAERDAKRAEKKAKADREKADEVAKVKRENNLMSRDEVAEILKKLLPDGAATTEDIKRLLAAA